MDRAMHYLFVGGPGRSGTSFVADRLGAHPEITTLKDIELKILCEKNGLLDLFHVLCESYSPNRAVMAMEQFRRMTEALIKGLYGQPALSATAPADRWRACFSGFAEGLLEDGHPVPRRPENFLCRARALLQRIAVIASGTKSPGTLFLEKTPHNLLAIGFLARLAPGARFLHVMRDPRSIAWSLLSVRWGPDELTTAARWVDSYCCAWIEAEATAARLGLPLTRLHIEDAATAPAEAGEWLAGQLGLDCRPGLLEGASLEVLTRWTAKASRAERALLDQLLGGWVAHFGYDPGEVGRRPLGGFPKPCGTDRLNPAAKTGGQVTQTA